VVIVAKQASRHIRPAATKAKRYPSETSAQTASGEAMILPILEPLSKTATTIPRSCGGNHLVSTLLARLFAEHFDFVPGVRGGNAKRAWMTELGPPSRSKTCASYSSLAVW
jgi:hypothetical protein